MTKKKYVCFSANRICHHDDYYLVFSQMVEMDNVKSYKTKLAKLFSAETIFFLDIDSRDLLFTPLIILRTLWGGKGICFSVRTEYLLEKKTFRTFLLERNRLKFVKSVFKRSLFYLIKNLSSTTILSIHKNTDYQDQLKPYVHDFIFDPQLWDLLFMKVDQCRPAELEEDFFTASDEVILVAGRLNEQRSRAELLNYLRDNRQHRFLFAGNMSQEDFELLNSYSNCTVINRFVSNEELFFLMDSCAIIYCFYTNSRPSGFFGRAVQFGKGILVREGSFLQTQFRTYNKLMPIKRLDEMDEQLFEVAGRQANAGSFNDSDDLKKIIEDR